MAHDLDIEQCYRRYAPMVFRRSRQLLGSDDKAYDAVQETFFQLARHRERLTSTAIAALLNRMATNVSLNLIRKERGFEAQSSQDLFVHIACSRGLEEQTWATKFLGKLWAQQQDSTRTIAVLHLVDGMTLEETAEEMGMSVSGVRKRLRKLKDFARQWEVTP